MKLKKAMIYMMKVLIKRIKRLFDRGLSLRRRNNILLFYK